MAYQYTNPITRRKAVAPSKEWYDANEHLLFPGHSSYKGSSAGMTSTPVQPSITEDARTQALKELTTLGYSKPDEQEINAMMTEISARGLTTTPVKPSVIETSDADRDKEKQGVLDKLKELTEQTSKDQTEVQKLTTQKQLEDIRVELGLDAKTGAVKPATPTYESDFMALRDEHGISAIETQINTIDAEMREAEALARSEIEKERGRLAPGESIGFRQTEIQRQATQRLDELNRRKQTLVDEYNTKAGLVNTIMGLKKMDYETANNEYNTAFNNNIKLLNIIEGRLDRASQEENRVIDDARANLTVMTNIIKESNLKWDDLDTDMQAQLMMLETKSGLPLGITQMFTETYPEADLLTSVTGTDADGNQVVSFIYKDKDGKPGVVETVNTGLKKTSGDDKDILKQAEIDSMKEYLDEVGDSAVYEHVFNEISQGTKNLSSTDIDSELAARGIKKSATGSSYLSDAQMKATSTSLIVGLGKEEALRSVKFGKINAKDPETKKERTITLSNEQKQSILSYINSDEAKELSDWITKAKEDPKKYRIETTGDNSGIYEKRWSLGTWLDKLVYKF